MISFKKIQSLGKKMEKISEAEAPNLILPQDVENNRFKKYKLGNNVERYDQAFESLKLLLGLNEKNVESDEKSLAYQILVKFENETKEFKDALNPIISNPKFPEDIKEMIMKLYSINDLPDIQSLDNKDPGRFESQVKCQIFDTVLNEMLTKIDERTDQIDDSFKFIEGTNEYIQAKISQQLDFVSKLVSLNSFEKVSLELVNNFIAKKILKKTETSIESNLAFLLKKDFEEVMEFLDPLIDDFCSNLLKDSENREDISEFLELRESIHKILRGSYHHILVLLERDKKYSDVKYLQQKIGMPFGSTIITLPIAALLIFLYISMSILTSQERDPSEVFGNTPDIASGNEVPPEKVFVDPSNELLPNSSAFYSSGVGFQRAYKTDFFEKENGLKSILRLMEGQIAGTVSRNNSENSFQDVKSGLVLKNFPRNTEFILPNLVNIDITKEVNIRMLKDSLSRYIIKDKEDSYRLDAVSIENTNGSYFKVESLKDKFERSKNKIIQSEIEITKLFIKYLSQNLLRLEDVFIQRNFHSLVSNSLDQAVNEVRNIENQKIFDNNLFQTLDENLEYIKIPNTTKEYLESSPIANPITTYYFNRDFAIDQLRFVFSPIYRFISNFYYGKTTDIYSVNVKPADLKKINNIKVPSENATLFSPQKVTSENYEKVIRELNRNINLIELIGETTNAAIYRDLIPSQEVRDQMAGNPVQRLYENQVFKTHRGENINIPTSQVYFADMIPIYTPVVSTLAIGIINNFVLDNDIEKSFGGYPETILLSSQYFINLYSFLTSDNSVQFSDVGKVETNKFIRNLEYGARDFLVTTAIALIIISHPLLFNISVNALNSLKNKLRKANERIGRIEFLERDFRSEPIDTITHLIYNENGVPASTRFLNNFIRFSYQRVRNNVISSALVSILLPTIVGNIYSIGDVVSSNMENVLISTSRDFYSNFIDVKLWAASYALGTSMIDVSLFTSLTKSIFSNFVSVDVLSPAIIIALYSAHKYGYTQYGTKFLNGMFSFMASRISKNNPKLSGTSEQIISDKNTNSVLKFNMMSEYITNTVIQDSNFSIPKDLFIYSIKTLQTQLEEMLEIKIYPEKLKNNSQSKEEDDDTWFYNIYRKETKPTLDKKFDVEKLPDVLNSYPETIVRGDVIGTWKGVITIFRTRFEQIVDRYLKVENNPFITDYALVLFELWRMKKIQPEEGQEMLDNKKYKTALFIISLHFLSNSFFTSKNNAYLINTNIKLSGSKLKWYSYNQLDEYYNNFTRNRFRTDLSLWIDYESQVDTSDIFLENSIERLENIKLFSSLANNDSLITKRSTNALTGSLTSWQPVHYFYKLVYGGNEENFTWVDTYQYYNFYVALAKIFRIVKLPTEIRVQIVEEKFSVTDIALKYKSPIIATTLGISSLIFLSLPFIIGPRALSNVLPEPVNIITLGGTPVPTTTQLTDIFSKKLIESPFQFSDFTRLNSVEEIIRFTESVMSFESLESDLVGVYNRFLYDPFHKTQIQRFRPSEDIKDIVLMRDFERAFLTLDFVNSGVNDPRLLYFNIKEFNSFISKLMMDIFERPTEFKVKNFSDRSRRTLQNYALKYYFSQILLNNSQGSIYNKELKLSTLTENTAIQKKLKSKGDIDFDDILIEIKEMEEVATSMLISNYYSNRDSFKLYNNTVNECLRESDKTNICVQLYNHLIKDWLYFTTDSLDSYLYANPKDFYDLFFSGQDIDNLPLVETNSDQLEFLSLTRGTIPSISSKQTKVLVEQPIYVWSPRRFVISPKEFVIGSLKFFAGYNDMSFNFKDFDFSKLRDVQRFQNLSNTIKLLEELMGDEVTPYELERAILTDWNQSRK